jgi:hypothetical protein
MRSAFLCRISRFLVNDTYCVYLLLKTRLKAFSNIQGPLKVSFMFGFGRFCEEEKLSSENTKPEKRSVDNEKACLPFSETKETLDVPTQPIAKQ